MPLLQRCEPHCLKFAARKMKPNMEGMHCSQPAHAQAELEEARAALGISGKPGKPGAAHSNCAPADAPMHVESSG